MELRRGSLVWLLCVLILAVCDENDIHLHATDVGTDTFTLTWDDVSNKGFTRYEVVLIGEEDSKEVIPVAAQSGEKPSQVIAGLAPGQAYNITVNGIRNGTKVPLENVLSIVLDDDKGNEMVIPLGGDAGKKPTEASTGQPQDWTQNGTGIALDGLVQYTAPLPPRDVFYDRLGGPGGIEVSWTPPDGKFNRFVIVYTLAGVEKREVVSGLESSFTVANPNNGTLEVISVSSAAGVSLDRLIESRPVMVRKATQGGGKAGKTVPETDGKPALASGYKTGDMDKSEQEGSEDTAANVPRWRVAMVLIAVTWSAFLVGLLVAAIVYIVRRRYNQSEA